MPILDYKVKKYNSYNFGAKYKSKTQFNLMPYTKCAIMYTAKSNYWYTPKKCPIYLHPTHGVFNPHHKNRKPGLAQAPTRVFFG